MNVVFSRIQRIIINLIQGKAARFQKQTPGLLKVTEKIRGFGRTLLISSLFKIIMENKYREISLSESIGASTHKVLAGEHFQQGDEIVAVA